MRLRCVVGLSCTWLGIIKKKRERDMILFSHSKNVMADSKAMSVIFCGVQGTKGSMHLNKSQGALKRLFGGYTYLFLLSGSSPRNRPKSYIGVWSSSSKTLTSISLIWILCILFRGDFTLFHSCGKLPEHLLCASPSAKY